MKIVPLAFGVIVSLTVIPHALSFEQNRRWRYRKEIEVIGTVVAAFVRRVV